MRSLAAWLCLLAATTVSGQNVGTLKAETHLPLPLYVCTAPGACTKEANNVVLDANWRWTHTLTGSTNCYDGNKWDATLCPDPATCTSNCAVEPTPSDEWPSPYGVTVSNEALNVRFVTQGPYSKNIGSRLYMLDSTKDKYRMFNLLNKEFTFDVDVSTLECGLNGALYFVDMDADGGLSKYSTNKGGARLGTGYCDAQCPHDVKWINGLANSREWKPSSNDANSGTGHFGSCCAELDIWEANKYAQAFTTHPCTTSQQTECEGVTCGDNATGDRYKGICDKDGCDHAAYRLNDKTFFGPGLKVDSTKPMTVVTQFITNTGTDSGDLIEMRRFYVQNGRKIDNAFSNWSQLAKQYDSVTEAMCDDVKNVFGDINDHKAKGGLKQMSDAMKRGMVLVMSLWDDHDVNMLWLDSQYPPGCDVTKPGCLRGPCDPNSGVPSEVEDKWRDATTTFSNIKIGPIGSTTTF